MLDHLRQHIIDLLEPARTATVSTCGQAGVQAEILPCEAHGLNLFLLVPLTSEHLFNLEHEPTVLVTTDEWQLRGVARRLTPAEYPIDLALSRLPRMATSVVIVVRGHRLQVGLADGYGFSETIDFATEPPQLQ